MPSANPPKHRSAPPRRRIDTWRRAGSLVLAVLCFLAVPQVAQALFAARQAPAGTSVSTATVIAPTSITGSWSCRNIIYIGEGIDVDVTGVVAAGQAKNVTYSWQLIRNSQVRDSGNGLPSLSTSSFNDGAATVYTLTVQASVGSWTSPVATRTLTCERSNGNGGNLS